MEDAVNEFHWRKDEELCRLDATTPLTGTFQEYIHWYTEDHYISPNSRILSVVTMSGDHIGSCGCFNIDDVARELELGILIGEKEYWGNGYGMDVICTMVDSIFVNTHAQRIYLRTLDWNYRAQNCFKKCGFTTCGRIIRGEHKFLLMELKKTPESVSTFD